MSRGRHKPTACALLAQGRQLGHNEAMLDKDRKQPSAQGKVLVDATERGQTAAAREHGVSRESVRRWSNDLAAGEPQLVAAVADAKAMRDSALGGRIERALSAGLDFVARAAEQADPADPKMVAAVCEALRVVGELQLARDMIDARRELSMAPQPPTLTVAGAAPVKRLAHRDAL